MAAHAAFAAGIEQATWAAWRTLLGIAPDLGPRLQLSYLFHLACPAGRGVPLGPRNRARLVALQSRLRSGHEFINDCARPLTSPPTSASPPS